MIFSVCTPHHKQYWSWVKVWEDALWCLFETTCADASRSPIWFERISEKINTNYKHFNFHNEVLLTLCITHQTLIIIIIIIWQAPRAGSMWRILCSDWLPERARWSDTARLGLPVSFPQIKFRQSSSECTKVFFRRNYFLPR